MIDLLQNFLNKIIIAITSATVVVTSIFSPSTPTLMPSTAPQITQEILTITPTRNPTIVLTKSGTNISPTFAITPTPTITPDPKKGPGGIDPGIYPVDSLTQEQKQWLWNFYGHTGNAPVGYGGEVFVPTRAYIGSSKACFTLSGETVSENVYNGRKPITFDASCSENATVFRWSVNGGILRYFDNLPSNTIRGDEYSTETKIVTICPRCASPNEYGEVVWKIKLEVVGMKAGGGNYKPDYIEKEIRMKD